MEVHPDPPNALSDARSQLALEKFPDVVRQILEIYELSRKISVN
jgi:3-deoxy-D-manno-octulosonic acid (KDO) 8-phosphate synthase